MRSLLVYIMLAVATVVCHEAYGQSVDDVVEELARRNMDGVHVRVTEDSSTRSAVEAVEAQRRVSEVSGFRVVIYSNNGQYAGDNAERVMREFVAAYPHINAYLVYESPYFKISVGDCLTMEEAQILMAEISANYPKAFPKRESIKLEDLYDARRRGSAEQDSTKVVSPSVQIYGEDNILL